MSLPEFNPQTDTQNTVRKLARLVEVSVTLNSTRDVNQLLNFIIQTAAELLDCEATSILLYDENRCELHFTAATGSDPEKLAAIPVPLDSSIAGTIFRENRPLLINDVEQDSRHYVKVGTQVQFQTRNLLGVPMRIQERVTGVLEALNKRQGQFTDDDVHLLTVLASQAAVAIHNARLVQALQSAYDELNRLDQLKSSFMAIASHELRTPLGIILGYASYLQEGAQGEISEHLNIVVNSALKLRTLLEEMTNMNLLQMRAAVLDVKRIPIQTIIQAICAEMASTLEAKGHKLSLDLPSQPLMVNADMEKLGQVILNLLNNAVRFTPEKGQITVRAHLVHGEIWVEIQDNGIGILSADLDKIFTEFYQVEDHMIRRHGGLGLGLAIARGMVKLHDGRIWAESEGVGKGSTFKIALPVAP